MTDFRKFSGYGTQDQTLDQIYGQERDNLDRFREAHPHTYQHKQAKEILNRMLFERVMEIQEANGIQGGFNFRYLWQAVFGEEPKWVPQIIGSCVASSAMRAIGYRGLTEVTMFNDAEDLPGTEMTGRENNILTFAPFSYRAGRSIIGINGSGPRNDGSLCTGHGEGMQTYGALLCDAGVESDVYPEPRSEQLYRQWGGDDNLLNKFKDSERRIFVTEQDEILTMDDIKKTVVDELKPVHLGSDWAFQQGQPVRGWKTADGKQVYEWVRDNGDKWPHAMSVEGVVYAQNQWWVIILNQWGNFHSGRDWFPIRIETYNEWCNPMQRGTFLSIGELQMLSSDQYAF